jgi:hypothetical protein
MGCNKIAVAKLHEQRDACCYGFILFVALGAYIFGLGIFLDSFSRK